MLYSEKHRAILLKLVLIKCSTGKIQSSKHAKLQKRVRNLEEGFRKVPNKQRLTSKKSSTHKRLQCFRQIFENTFQEIPGSQVFQGVPERQHSQQDEDLECPMKPGSWVMQDSEEQGLFGRDKGFVSQFQNSRLPVHNKKIEDSKHAKIPERGVPRQSWSQWQRVPAEKEKVLRSPHFWMANSCVRFKKTRMKKKHKVNKDKMTREPRHLWDTLWSTDIPKVWRSESLVVFSFGKDLPQKSSLKRKGSTQFCPPKPKRTTGSKRVVQDNAKKERVCQDQVPGNLFSEGSDKEVF